MKERKKQKKAFTEKECFVIVNSVINALIALHHHNIWHRDIKPGRKPDLVEKIINMLSLNNTKCYVYPLNYVKIRNSNIINMGTMTETELNNLYNKHKVGIIFSNTNPSRLGFEMYASGLQVIEYDSEFTKYDMPDKYFVKIKTL